MSEFETPAMSQLSYSLTRIDRSVADNLKSIDRSFQEDSGIVKDFIIFISKRLKHDLFGYTKFTLNQFCQETGRNKQHLCEVHPHFINNPKAEPPVYNGHVFKSVFDYALLNMIWKNIVFDKSYSYGTNTDQTHLSKFSILQDIKLNHDRSNGTIKLYEIRLADDVIDGFISRYYTIDSKGYSKIGKGRGGDGRKSLYVLLEKTRHILLSKSIPSTKFTVDYIANIGGIKVTEPRNRKTSVKRVLDTMVQVGELDFTYKFVRGDESQRYQEDYWVELTFNSILAEAGGDNVFFLSLMENLRALFLSTYKGVVIKDEKDPFQRWLTNTAADLEFKAQEVSKAFYKAYNRELPLSDAKAMIRTGNLWESLTKKTEQNRISKKK